MSVKNLLNVFQYWGQGFNAMPLFIKIIYKHNLEFCKKNNINLILIDDNNVYNYITPHLRFKTLDYNFKSDIIRYYILHKYGGLWFDTDVIIIKDLNNLYESISGYECMLDIEYGIKIGCCSLFIKKQSSVSKFCIDYINNILDKNENLEWNDIGPDTVEALYKKHQSLILLNNYETVKNGCNFICWNKTPGINKQNWYLESENLAKSKADFLKNNINCYYLITWTIYRINDMGDRLNNMVFNDNRSVFSYFINYEHKKIIVKNSKIKKYAVMWASTVNIGDDIQTLAAIHFLKKKGITEYSFIDREKLSDYDGEPVKLIMNGWYMQNINKFPPSDKITPIFISVHINNEFLISNNINYFKKHQPIGCRDESTIYLFKKNGINAYFTGSLTLLFDDVKEKTGGKYLVDVNTKCNYIPNVELDTSKYNNYQLIEHDISSTMPLKERLIMAEELLNKYRNAEQVITTRLHCILPCRAFNTDSIFIHKNYVNDPRFSGLKNIINGDTKNHSNTCGNKNEINKIRKNFLLLKI
ncbi:MAG: hypothetical protein CMI95_04355 [Pelagibacteraceae bacterium]|nr:hypothetical protein [Pelagibacteraceae bacterium]